MRLAFAGTPEFASIALQALLEAGHTPSIVLTQPDRPAGRGLKLQPSAVKRCAIEHGLAVIQPRGLRLDGKYAEDAAQARIALARAAPEVMVVAAYGLILPAWALTLPERGCLNIHASLLPRWRGAAPIHRAIEAGDAQSGISIMQMDDGLDTGAILLQSAIDIAAADTTATLHDRLAHLGADLCVQALDELIAGRLVAVAQPSSGITYAAKIEKAEAVIDWRQLATQIERRIRAFEPTPGASLVLDEETIKVRRARLARHPQAEPGRVLITPSGQCLVACSEGWIELLEVQRPGGRRIAASDWLQSTRNLNGRVLP